MNVSVDISYYPLKEDFIKPIDDFIKKLNQNQAISVETGKLSTVLMGEYTMVMKLLTESMGDLMTRYPSVFTVKITNYCPT